MVESVGRAWSGSEEEVVVVGRVEGSSCGAQLQGRLQERQL